MAEQPMTVTPEMAAPPPAPQSTQVPVLPPEHWQTEPELENDDADSALGDDTASSTASISSSILKYRTIHGRTYHSEIGNAHYWTATCDRGSNDEGHNDSLDILHHMFSLALDGELFTAPIGDNPGKVLDIGTGTGIWAIDFAEEYPGCEVIGTGISPTQPSWVPPNVKFEIEDATQVWTFRDTDFDFVHTRYLMGCIQDWAGLFKQAYRCIQPGGWLQSYEASASVHTDDDTLPSTSAIAQWEPLFTEGGLKSGRSFTVVEDGTQNKAMQEAGFVDIQEKWIKIPSGGWPKDPKLKEIGRYSQAALLSDPEGFILFFTFVLSWSREQVHVYLAHLRRDLTSLRHHVYYWQKIVWAKKPEAA